MDMDKLKNLLTEITDITYYIETNYPELYQFLGEDPMTLPTKKHPHMNKKVMEEYLEDLKQLLKHHLETHQSKKP